MDMHNIKWTRLQSDIFRLLCIRAGQTLNLREIARELKVSPTAVSNSLGGLTSEGLVEAKKSSSFNLLSISINRDNPMAVQMKRVENLRMVYESGLAHFLHEEFPGCAVILFGSYSLGEDVFSEAEERRSDIDIAVVGAKEKHVNTEKFGKLLERTINMNFYESWGRIHKHLKDNILNGITLSGGVEL